MYQVLQSDLPKVTLSGLENVTSIWGINQKVTLKKLVSYSSSDSLHQNKNMLCFFVERRVNPMKCMILIHEYQYNYCRV